jgi:hypothetical protein
MLGHEPDAAGSIVGSTPPPALEPEPEPLFAPLADPLPESSSPVDPLLLPLLPLPLPLEPDDSPLFDEPVELTSPDDPVSPELESPDDELPDEEPELPLLPELWPDDEPPEGSVDPAAQAANAGMTSARRAEDNVQDEVRRTMASLGSAGLTGRTLEAACARGRDRVPSKRVTISCHPQKEAWIVM